MRGTQRGFTMIELMVVVTVLAILMAVGVPSFKHFIAGQRVKSTSIELVGALILARSEAIKRNADVTIEPNTSGSWASGWTVKSGATLLSEQGAVERVTIAVTMPSGGTTLVYKPSGRPAASPNTFLITGTTTSRCIKVDASGVPNTQSTACA